MNDVYRVGVDGGTPMPVSADRYANEFGAAASPDGRRLAHQRARQRVGQWWRKGAATSTSARSGSSTWSRRPTARRVHGNHQARPRAAVADVERRRRGAVLRVRPQRRREHLDAAGRRRRAATGAVTTLHRRPRAVAVDHASTARRSRSSATSASGRSTRRADSAREVPIVRRGAAPAPAPDRVRQTSQFSRPRAVARRQEGRVRRARRRLRGLGEGRRRRGARDRDDRASKSQPVWAPDSRRLAYVSRAQRRRGSIYLYDFATRTETRAHDAARRRTSVAVVLAGRQVDGVPPQLAGAARRRPRRRGRIACWPRARFRSTLRSPAPDVVARRHGGSRCSSSRARRFTNVALVPLAGGGAAPGQLPRQHERGHDRLEPRRHVSAVRHGPAHRSRAQLARVDLTLRTPKFREDQFRDLFSEPGNAVEPRGADARARPRPPRRTPPPRRPPRRPRRRPRRRSCQSSTGSAQRLSLLPLGLDVSDVAISPDGKTAVLVAAAAGQRTCTPGRSTSWRTSRPVARQLTSTAGGKADIAVHARQQGGLLPRRRAHQHRHARPARAAAARRDGGARRGFRAREARRSSSRRWTLLRDNFFDPQFNGVDWDAVARRRTRRASPRAATPDEMRRMISLMIGDLNASHLGISGPADAARHRPARAGVRSRGVRGERPAASHRRRAARARGGRRRHRGRRRADRGGRRAGGRGRQPRRAAREHDRSPRRAHVVDARWRDARRRRAARRIRPRRRTCSTGSGSSRSATYVLKVSGGRLGYVHMFDMSAGALDQLYVDLDAENHARDGVVIDIRNNNGGFVNAYAHRRLRAAAVPAHDAARHARGARAHAARPALARAGRPCSSPTSTRSRTPRISPKATAR